MSLSKIDTQTDQGSLSQPPLNLPATYDELSASQDPHRIAELAAVIVSHVTSTQGYEFQGCLQLVLKIVSKGYAGLLTESTLLIGKIMAHFVVLSKALKTVATPQMQYRQLFTLSILAELIRQEPKYQLPFTLEFSRALFEIEAEAVGYDSRARLMTLLGVLYNNLSRQSALLRELKMAPLLKEAVLQNYPLIEEKFTAKLFNQCIVQLQTRNLAKFTIAEIERYGVKAALTQTVGGGKKEVIEHYLEKLFGKKQG